MMVISDQGHHHDVRLITLKGINGSNVYIVLSLTSESCEVNKCTGSLFVYSITKPTYLLTIRSKHR